MEKTKLIETRKLKGLSQSFLAEKLCVTVSNYNRRERGQTKISRDEWQKLANALEVPLEEIYEPEESQVFIFNDSATGNVNSIINYNVPLSMWETQKKYIEKLEQEIQKLKDSL
ncbi:helix-turn-helix transcriptional regulator [Chryseobacterium sp. R2A-55]|uniref:helix-turn-helix transcriptional regulator n=1 Tax=Chryseobacterium sp. R2A-55 TaxID=2744445 RepID=UPI001F482EF0|nr:helix-turn-helix transcriptional regulator [Chryseobacterium sp. R2A-55]